MSGPHVQIIVDQKRVPPRLQAALNRLNARVSMRSIDKARTSGVSRSADVCVILPGERSSEDVMNQILSDASDQACATMVLVEPDAADWARADVLERIRVPSAGAADERQPVAMSTDELIGRLKALCDVRLPLQRMKEELTRLRRRDEELTSGARIVEEQLALASQIQADLLPALPRDLGPLSVSTLYLPAERVSGDLYDVSRLDDNHLSFSIADATGHGMPAALLTIFIRNSLRGTENVNGSSRIIEPDELLTRLNRDLCRTNLTQCQFITALHAVFDCRTNQIRWARGGIPYPILLRPGQEPREIASEGGLIGAFDTEVYELVTHKLESGDTLLFYTDGMDLLLATRQGDPDSQWRTWLDRLAHEGPEPALADIRHRAAQTPETKWRKDDIAAIVIKMP